MDEFRLEDDLGGKTWIGPSWRGTIFVQKVGPVHDNGYSVRIPQVVHTKVWGLDVSRPRALPKARALVIPERGCKVRVVTALEAETVIKGHNLRDAIWPILEEDRRFDLGQSDDPIAGMPVPKGRVVLSADLSRATDVAPQWLGIQFCLELARTLQLSNKWRWAAVAAFGSYEVSYPKGQRITSSVGWLMGHPLTWAILCLVHREIAELCGFDDYRIRGDDLLAVGPPESVDKYFNLISRYFLVNKKKSFVSETGGVFAEETYMVTSGVLTRVTSSMVPKGTLQGDLAAFAPCYATYETLPKRRRQAYRHALLAACPEQVKALKGRVPIFLPRVLGGVGIPKRGGVGAAVAGSVLATKAVTGAGAPAAAWHSRSEYRQRTEILDFCKDVTTVLGREGGLSRHVPLSESALNAWVLRAQLALGSAGWGGDDLRPPSIKSLAADWKAYKERLRNVKPPPHLLGKGWTEQRLRYCITRNELAGAYRSYQPDFVLSTL